MAKIPNDDGVDNENQKDKPNRHNDGSFSAGIHLEHSDTPTGARVIAAARLQCL